MFADIPQPIAAEMSRLEELDGRDRVDGTPRLERLRQIPPETGRFISLLAAAAPAGHRIEIGTSAGYSTLWLVLAGAPITTFEILADKAARARETFRRAGVDHLVELVEADARDHLATVSDVAFCFLDAEKEVYADCYELVVPSLVPGGLLLADNAINHRETLQPLLDRALGDPRVDALVVPIGKGVLTCRRTEMSGPARRIP